MKKFTVGYDDLNKEYLILDSPKGVLDENAIRYRDSPSLAKNLELYLKSHNGEGRLIGLLIDIRSKDRPEISRLVSIIQDINLKTVILK